MKKKKAQKQKRNDDERGDDETDETANRNHPSTAAKNSSLTHPSVSILFFFVPFFFKINFIDDRTRRNKSKIGFFS